MGKVWHVSGTGGSPFNADNASDEIKWTVHVPSRVTVFRHCRMTLELKQAFWVVLWYIYFLVRAADHILCSSSMGDCFSLQMIDGEAFLLLTQNDIVKIMNIKLGPALKIHNAILMFKSTDEGLKWAAHPHTPRAVTIQSITCLVFKVWTHQRERNPGRTISDRAAQLRFVVALFQKRNDTIKLIWTQHAGFYRQCFCIWSAYCDFQSIGATGPFIRSLMMFTRGATRGRCCPLFGDH